MICFSKDRKVREMEVSNRDLVSASEDCVKICADKDQCKKKVVSFNLVLIFRIIRSDFDTVSCNKIPILFRWQKNCLIFCKLFFLMLKSSRFCFRNVSCAITAWLMGKKLYSEQLTRSTCQNECFDECYQQQSISQST